MTPKVKERLLKIYPPRAKKIRRKIVNLYRPILHDKSTSKFNQDLMAYIMFGLFFIGLILELNDINHSFLPFIVGWIVIPLTWVYFRFYPITWDEMYEYEKKAFRDIWRLPPSWTPINDKFGSEGRVSGKKHSTK
jgi:hypothetical protein